MACFYSSKHDMLVLKCDACGCSVDLYRGETDRTLKLDYIRENGWKMLKMGGKWLDICRACKAEMERKKRDAFMQEFFAGRKVKA